MRKYWDIWKTLIFHLSFPILKHIKIFISFATSRTRHRHCFLDDGDGGVNFCQVRHSFPPKFLSYFYIKIVFLIRTSSVARHSHSSFHKLNIGTYNSKMLSACPDGWSFYKWADFSLFWVEGKVEVHRTYREIKNFDKNISLKSCKFYKTSPFQ